MNYGQTLIDKAAATLGSRYKVAKETRVSESTLTSVMAGRRPLAPLVAAKLAIITGDDPREAVCGAELDQVKDDDARQEMARLLNFADWRKR